MLAHSKKKSKVKGVVKDKKVTHSAKRPRTKIVTKSKKVINTEAPKIKAVIKPKKESKVKEAVTRKTGAKAKKKRLKIAVQLYGHLRTFEICAPALKKHVLDHYDCDVFIHTWDEIGYSTKEAQGSKEENVIPVDDEVLAKVEMLYKPKLLKVESQKEITNSKYFKKYPKHIPNILTSKLIMYKLFKVNNEREVYSQKKNICYDYILVSRPDIQIKEKLSFNSIQKEFEFFSNTCIHFVACHPKIGLVDRNYLFLTWGSDCFLVSKPQVISTISKIYLEFNYYFVFIHKFYKHNFYAPEIYLNEYLIHKNIRSRYLNFDFSICRKNNSDKKYVFSAIFQFIIRAFFYFIPSPLLKLFRYFLNSCTIIEKNFQRLEHSKNSGPLIFK